MGILFDIIYLLSVFFQNNFGVVRTALVELSSIDVDCPLGSRPGSVQPKTGEREGTTNFSIPPAHGGELEKTTLRRSLRVRVSIKWIPRIQCRWII
jgi:hypothetical protein